MKGMGFLGTQFLNTPVQWKEGQLSSQKHQGWNPSPTDYELLDWEKVIVPL